jgi:hypothetical protein
MDFTKNEPDSVQPHLKISNYGVSWTLIHIIYIDEGIY